MPSRARSSTRSSGCRTESVVSTSTKPGVARMPLEDRGRSTRRAAPGSGPVRSNSRSAKRWPPLTKRLTFCTLVRRSGNSASSAARLLHDRRTARRRAPRAPPAGRRSTPSVTGHLRRRAAVPLASPMVVSRWVTRGSCAEPRLDAAKSLVGALAGCSPRGSAR